MSLQLGVAIPNIFKHGNSFSQGLGSERKGNNFVVSKDGSGDFDNIQDAIKASSNGTQIFIKNGTYLEKIPLDIKSDIKIQGESLNTIIKLVVTTTSTELVKSYKKMTMRDLTIIADNTSEYTQNCMLWDLGADSEDIYFENVTFKTIGQLNHLTKGIFSGTTGIKRLSFINCNSKEVLFDGDFFLYATATITNLEITGGIMEVTNITSIENSRISNMVTTSPLYLDVAVNCKITQNNVGDELTLLSGCLRNTIHGNKATEMYINAGSNFNAVTGNLTDYPISDSGTNNVLSGNVVY